MVRLSAGSGFEWHRFDCEIVLQPRRTAATPTTKSPTIAKPPALIIVT